MATTTPASASRGTSASDAPTGRSLVLAALVCCASPLALMAQDLPTGGQVVSGNVSIGAPSGGAMTVQQGSDRAIVNWNSFDVGAGHRLRFEQPGANSAILNRVTGNTGTSIHGQISANGQVHVVNPNGILIGPNGQVQAAGGFVASTLDISNEDFRQGQLRYQGGGASASVRNQGTISIGRGGYAALLGGHVSNSGTVSVPMGRVGFASGERVVLDLSGDGFMQVSVPTKAESAEGQALIENAGRVAASGGRIEMTAATARNAVRHAVNLSGVAEASSVSTSGGTIILGGGPGGQVTVSGRVSARAAPPPAQLSQSSRPPERPQGGNIDITGGEIRLTGARIDASGIGGGGRIRIGGDFGGQGDLPRARRLVMDEGSRVVSDGLEAGNGGRIALWSDLATTAEGRFSARGGPDGGDGGFVEVSAARDLRYRGTTDTRAPQGQTGQLLLDPGDIIIAAGSSAQTLSNTLATTNVELNTSCCSLSGGAGNITINGDITWTSENALILRADNNIVLNAAITATNGFFDLNAENQITTGPGGRVNVANFYLGSGDWRQVGNLPQFAARNFTVEFGASFLRASGGNGSSSPYVIRDVYGLQGIGTSEQLLSSNYVLGNNINASVTRNWGSSFFLLSFFGGGFSPIGDGETPFTGNFDGAGRTISGLYIAAYSGEGSAQGVGLFGQIGRPDSEIVSSVRNLTLTGIDYIGGAVGGLAAVNFGNISAVRVSGSIVSSDIFAGGLVGGNAGVIEDSIADVDVTSEVPFFSFENQIATGGAVGANVGTIARTHALGTVRSIADSTQSESSLQLAAGGFVGANLGVITDSYARGDVIVESSGNLVAAGGFAGVVDDGGRISTSYSTGQVPGDGIAPFPGFALRGGFVGANFGGIVDGSNFWDVTSSGLGSSAGGQGLTTAQMQDTDGFIALAESQGWVFDGEGATWAPGAAGRYASNYTTSRVIFYRPRENPVSIVYGETRLPVTGGTFTGGPDLYVFDDPARGNLNLNDRNYALSFGTGGRPNVGSTTWRLGPTSISIPGEAPYAVVSATGTALITPRPLTIAAQDRSKTVGTGIELGLGDVSIERAGSTGARGLVSGDSVTGITVTSPGTAASAPVASYEITASDAEGSGLENYAITYLGGTLVVNDVAPLPTPGPTPPPVDIAPVPNHRDTITGRGGVLAALNPTGGGAQTAAETLAITRGIAADLTRGAQACATDAADVELYLSCLSDALSSFAGQLDSIVTDLPPGLENVAQIVQDARAGVDAARANASRRLAGASSDAERAAIRRDAIAEANAALATASDEIRKAITLVRVDDPELAAIQRETITTVAAAVDSVNIELSRVVGL